MNKKVPLLPNVITAFGLSCGLFVIFRMAMTEFGESDYHRLMTSVGILLMAAFADLLDGAVARAMKSESDFGGIFDSLADAISFGVAPALMVLKSLSLAPGTELSFLVMTAAMVYSVSGVLRLVRFSVTANREKGDEEAVAASKKNFTGLPIPAAAAAAISMNLFLVSPEFRSFFSITEEARAIILFCSLVILGYLMISRLKFPSLKALRIRVASFQIVFLTAISAVFIFYGIVQHFAVVLFCVSWAYVVVSLLLSLIRYITGKKMKTLEEFDPEPDDIE